MRDLFPCLSRTDERRYDGDAFDCRTADVVIWRCERFGESVSALPLKLLVATILGVGRACADCDRCDGKLPRWVSGEGLPGRSPKCRKRR